MTRTLSRKFVITGDAREYTARRYREVDNLRRVVAHQNSMAVHEVDDRVDRIVPWHHLLDEIVIQYARMHYKGVTQHVMDSGYHIFGGAPDRMSHAIHDSKLGDRTIDYLHALNEIYVVLKMMAESDQNKIERKQEKSIIRRFIDWLVDLSLWM